ncbi:hypothetical protein FQN49_000009 [Arthroderma sp. PD_2]|nr:hypothetical protein FQN49_000009 [Arthroderma sp. PD_2]
MARDISEFVVADVSEDMNHRRLFHATRSFKKRAVTYKKPVPIRHKGRNQRSQKGGNLATLGSSSQTVSSPKTGTAASGATPKKTTPKKASSKKGSASLSSRYHLRQSTTIVPERVLICSEARRQVSIVGVTRIRAESASRLIDLNESKVRESKLKEDLEAAGQELQGTKGQLRQTEELLQEAREELQQANDQLKAV